VGPHALNLRRACACTILLYLVREQHSPFESVAQMKKLALISTLLLAASPAAAQVATSQSEAGTQTPTTGVECTEEMTATFCNVASGPSEGGYGSGLSSTGVSTSSGGSGTSVSASGGGASLSSVPPCPSEPPFNELCN
jgi:uncharacterized membrane protein YgcG